MPTTKHPTSVFGTFKYVLPFPPSINHYWRSYVPKGGKRAITYVSNDGVKFQKAVAAVVNVRHRSTRRLKVLLQLQRGDFVDYDVGNYIKSTEDALAKAGVFVNDSQIDIVTAERLPVKPGEGACYVTIQEIGFAKTKRKVNVK